MQHSWSLDSITLPNAWVTIGTFDGVHRGHQAIIQPLVRGAHAADSPAIVVTFFPHPALVLGRRLGPLYLTNPDEKAALLAQAGIDLVVTLRFNPELAALTAREFMLLLKQHLGVVHLQVGSDFALGRGRQGDIPTLRALGEELGYALAVTEPVRAGSEVISSSRIRTALVEGDLGLATQLLGRPYKVSGEVIHGDGRGRDLGIPTANLDVWAEQIIPRSGVYACRAQTQTGSYLALTNIGVRPTFHSEPVAPRVESMLLDFSGDLYGQPIDIYFISRLRDEQRFASVEALINQIQIDIQHARDTLSQS